MLVSELDGRDAVELVRGGTMSGAPSLGKDLVGLEELSAEQIRLILDTAEPFKEVSERPIKKVPALRGKTIVNLFFEASHPDPDLLRVRREAALRRHGQRGRRRRAR